MARKKKAGGVPLRSLLESLVILFAAFELFTWVEFGVDRQQVVELVKVLALAVGIWIAGCLLWLPIRGRF